MSKVIVWIEDDVDVIYPVVRHLEQAGFQIKKLRSPEQALNAIEQISNADLILLDMLMPLGGEALKPESHLAETTTVDTAAGRRAVNGLKRYPGIQLLRELRENHNIKTPVVVLTVITQANILQELQKLGVADIVRKPVLPSELKERVERALKPAD